MTHVPAGTEAGEAAVSVTGASRHGGLDSSLASTSTALSGSSYESVLLALLEGLRHAPLGPCLVPLPLAHHCPCPHCSPLPAHLLHLLTCPDYSVTSLAGFSQLPMSLLLP